MAAIDEESNQAPLSQGALRALTSAALALPGLRQPSPSPLRTGGLQALKAAALALPGLMHSAPGLAAEDNSIEVQFGQYRESARNLYGLQSKFSPIESDGLHAAGKFDITDRWKATISFRQDTWSGATPMATAPQEWRGNRSRAPDGVSGATPYLVNTSGLYLDKATLQPLNTDGFGNLTGGVNTQLVHTISGASRETRKQVDFRISRDWTEAGLDLGIGTSVERDYTSRYGSIGARWDFNQKLTTVNFGMSYTDSSSDSILDHDAAPYIFNSCGTPACNFVSTNSYIENLSGGKKVIHGDRYDIGAVTGVTQVLNQNAQIAGILGYTRSRGYLANPYKVVEIGFIDPDQQFLAPPGTYYITTNSLLETRPDKRDQWLFDVRYAQYVPAADAATHLHYAYFHDDWGIRASTVEADWVQPVGSGWSITPRIRYYTQTAADFYTPYLITDQGPYRIATVNGRPTLVPFDLSKLPAYYSSDWRLAAFGALGGGVVVSKQFAKGVTLDLGYEYYKHASGLKWGGGGSGSYTDFHSYLWNAALRFDMDALSAGKGAPMQMPGHEGHVMPGGHAGHEGHLGMLAPAGVMWGHALNAGDFMAGVRYVYSRNAGRMMNGSNAVDDAQIRASACEKDGCLTAPTKMNMDMYMLELMYAPTDWLTLMLMPMYMDMSMNMRGLLTPAEQARLPFDINALYEHHTLHQHETGGIGDIGIYATFKMWEAPGHNLLGTLGVTAPTGDVDIQLRPTHQLNTGFQHYHMQLGSGTWDFNPSLTYNGLADKWFWGAQLSGTMRMENRNDSGYRLGNIFQGTFWGGYRVNDGLSASLRGVYTRQGAIEGEFNGPFYKLGSVDYPSNYGGRFWDLGLGASYTVQSGTWAGNQFSIEWLQPLKDDFNGYQIERKGMLNANWMYTF